MNMGLAWGRPQAQGEHTRHVAATSAYDGAPSEARQATIALYHRSCQPAIGVATRASRLTPIIGWVVRWGRLKGDMSDESRSGWYSGGAWRNRKREGPDGRDG